MTQKCKQNYSKENKSKQKSSCLDSRCQKMNFKTDWEIYKRIMIKLQTSSKNFEEGLQNRDFNQINDNLMHG